MSKLPGIFEAPISIRTKVVAAPRAPKTAMDIIRDMEREEEDGRADVAKEERSFRWYAARWPEAKDVMLLCLDSSRSIEQRTRDLSAMLDEMLRNRSQA